MARFGVLTDSHGLENLEVIARSMSTQGIDSAIHLGDMAYQTMSENTATEAFAAQRKLGALVTATPIQAAALSGEFTNKQLLDVIETNKTARQVSDKIAIANYQELDSIFTKNGVTLDMVLGGNWDRNGLDDKDDVKPMSEVFGDRFVNGKVKTLKGHKILGLSGSGSAYGGMTVNDGLMADNPLHGSTELQKWREPLRSNEDLDMLISHIPFTSGKNKQDEQGIENFKKLFKARREGAGLKHPKVFLSGHVHRSTSVEYNEELDVLWVQPGVSALNHNNGQHGSYVIMNTNDETKEVESVEEYRVFNLDNGTQEVEHYGTHFVDLTKEKNKDKVRFERVGTMVIEDHVKKHEDFLQLDANYKALQKGISTDYSSAKTAKDKEQHLKNNLALIAKAKEHGSDLVRMVVNTERRYLSKKLGKRKLTNTILEESRDRVFKQLSDYAAQSFGGVDYTKLVKEGSSEEGARNATLFFAYGINREHIDEALSVGQATEVEKLSHSWGAILAQKASQHIENELRNGVVFSFTGQDFQDIIELYTANNLERVGDIKDVREGFQVWSEMNEKLGGLMTSDYGVGTGLYKINGDANLKKRTEEELYGLLGVDELMKKNIKSEEEAEKHVPRNQNLQKMIEERQRQEQAQRDATQKDDPQAPNNSKEQKMYNRAKENFDRQKNEIQEKIDDGNFDIYRDKQGDEYFVQQGQKHPLQDFMKNELKYETKSLEGALENGDLEEVMDKGQKKILDKREIEQEKANYQQMTKKSQVYQNKQGNHLMVNRGNVIAVPEYLHNRLDYDTKSLEEAVETKDLEVVQEGDKQLLFKRGEMDVISEEITNPNNPYKVFKGNDGSEYIIKMGKEMIPGIIRKRLRDAGAQYLTTTLEEELDSKRANLVVEDGGVYFATQNGFMPLRGDEGIDIEKYLRRDYSSNPALNKDISGNDTSVGDRSGYNRP